MSAYPFVIHSSATGDGALAEAGKVVSEYLERFASEPVLLLASGGSALRIFSHIKWSTDTSHITLTVLDERYSTDEKINNFAQLAALPFFAGFVASGGKTIDTRVREGESLQQLTQRFDGAMRQWKSQYPYGKVIAIQGMGPDGHTSGIMPYPEDANTFHQIFEDASVWVAGVDVGAKNPYPLRVTTTMTFLREVVDVAIAYIVGSDKRDALERLLTQETPLFVAPVEVLKSMKNVVIITDASAYEKSAE